ncbi:MFS transporter [Streptomyces sp. NA02950]|uniref:MFS transporter n=1 Tax=Streptomyces sp. NA02950 TaxID=2742137 RepID=UPI0015910A75|nr:MFS transporter [Streptomyces sp. NA02950]QKV91075.1 MFS transporter [Streptomyces sp. NA02950]
MRQTTPGTTGTSTGPTTPTSPPADAVRHRWWILAAIGIAQLMAVLDATVVNIALPSAQRDLGFSDGDRQWIVTAYSLCFGSLLLLGGRLADLFGRRAVFLIGVAGFAAASALAGAAGGFGLLVTGRALQGLFAALLAPAALSLLNTTFTDPRERAKAFGAYGAIAVSGGGIGLLLGGLLTEHLSWRWTLYVNLGFAALALAGGVAFLRRGAPADRPRLDLPGTVLVSAGLFGLVYGFSNAESHSWSSPLTWGFLTAGTVLLIAFARWQTRTAHPLLPPRVLLDRDRGASFLAIGLSGAGMFGVFLFLTYYLQGGLRFSPVQTGLAFLPMIGGLMVTAQFSTGILVPRLGPKAVVPLGMGLTAIAMVWLTGLDLDSGYAVAVLPPLLASGIGLGLVMPPAMAMATDRIGSDDAGVASAAVNTMQQIGGSIGTALLNTLAAEASADYLAAHGPGPVTAVRAQLHSYEVAYWWSAGFFVAGVLLTAALYRKGRTGKDADTPVAVPV